MLCTVVNMGSDLPVAGLKNGVLWYLGRRKRGVCHALVARCSFFASRCTYRAWHLVRVRLEYVAGLSLGHWVADCVPVAKCSLFFRFGKM